MNTFKILNKAVVDENLSSTGFRLLFSMVHLMNKYNTNELNLYNSKLAELTHLTDAQVKRCTKELHDNGYITKTVYKYSQNNKPNKYTIIEQS